MPKHFPWPLLIAAVLAAACESTEPDLLAPTLTLDGETVAVAAAPVVVTVTAQDDRGLAELIVAWGDGVSETRSLTGASVTTELQHTFTSTGDFEVLVTLSDAAGQTANRSLTIGVVAASLVVEPARGDTINAVGFTVGLSARGYDALGAELPDFQPAWQVLDAGIATVDVDGTVTAVAPGEARVRASSGAAADTVVVLVRQVPKAVALTAPDTLGVREPRALDAVVTDSNAVVIPDAVLTWSSSAPSVATVDAAGEVMGVGEGSVLVTAAVGPAAGTAAIEVALAILFAAPAQQDSPYLDLHTITRHGTVRRNVSNREYSDYGGAWSPDRRSIAFWSASAGNGKFMIMGADGSDAREIDTGLALAREFAWAPDGARIAFTGRPADASDDIWVIGVDGAGLTKLTTYAGHERSPAWSADGARIAFERFVEGGSSDIHVMHADGSSVVNLTNSPATEVAPVWSPDGTEIAFSSDASDGLPVIHRMNVDGTNVRRIGNHPTIYFDWSPEGTFFCFVAFADGQPDVFIMPADGGTITNVTNDGLTEQNCRWR